MEFTKPDWIFCMECAKHLKNLSINFWNLKESPF
jgi:hypothetical protein